MTNAPHLLEKSREGFKYGDVTLHDHMAQDGLWDAFTDQPMGLLTEAANTGDIAFSREEQDEFAARSHQLAARAWKDGVFDDEVVSVSIPQRKGDPLEFRSDEGIRADTTPRLAGPAAPGLLEGRHDHRRVGLADLRRGVRRRRHEEVASRGASVSSGSPRSVPTAWWPAPTRRSRASRPAPSRRHASAKGITPADLDLVEINEAFAAVGLASAKELGIDLEKVNVNGGAIALGHPIGMSGARITLHLAHELRRRGGGVGVAALCGGGGQGDALVVKVPARG